MKRFVKFFSLLLSLNIIFGIFTIPVHAKADAPAVTADGVVLMDGTTGEILYSKNPDVQYPPASTTKTMTALLTLERCNLDDVVTIGKNPPVADGSKIYLFEGEQIKVKDLLYGLLLVSGNDCAEALAEHMSGSVANFAEVMNKRAKELGCKNTNFVNPSGLYDDNHRTTAADLALIMRELSKKPEFTEISTTLSYKIAPTNKSPQERPLWNENRLIQKYSKYYYEACRGGKTGYTIQSLHSYTAAATKDGHTLVVALMHDKDKTFFDDSKALFDYGFANYEYVKLFSKGDMVKDYSEKGVKIPLRASEDIGFFREKGSGFTSSLDIDTERLGTNSIKKGEVACNATLKLPGGTTFKTKLLSDVDYAPAAPVQAMKIAASSKYPYLAFATITAVAVLIAAVLIKRKRKKSEF